MALKNSDLTSAMNGTNDVIDWPLFNVRLLFYLIHPREIPETKNVRDLPHYPTQVIPVFLGMICIELFIKWWHTGSGFRINDTITSMGAGLAAQSIKLITRGLDLVVYVWIFDHFRLCTIPLRLWWSWGLAFLAADLAYYWIHRLNHEISILWASHQTHHSSEDYNLSTALRQSITGALYGWIVYLPMAFLGFTPVAHVVHLQLNLLYQFWIHTAVIKNLGPFEWILNTPSHHRVHHGRNAYCIDKNYAGALIIWDRMFGTFEPEHDDEPVVYGIISPVNSFNGIWIQFNIYISVIKKSLGYKAVEDKIRSLVMGPGWYPGTKRLGSPDDIPAIENPVRIYEVQISTWRKIYALLHCAVLLMFYGHAAGHSEDWTREAVYVVFLGTMFTVGSVGALFDDRKWAPYLEFLRCVAVWALLLRGDEFSLSVETARACRLFHALSAVSWLVVLGCQTFFDTTPVSSKNQHSKSR